MENKQIKSPWSGENVPLVSGVTQALLTADGTSSHVSAASITVMPSAREPATQVGVLPSPLTIPFQDPALLQVGAGPSASLLIWLAGSLSLSWPSTITDTCSCRGSCCSSGSGPAAGGRVPGTSRRSCTPSSRWCSRGGGTLPLL